MAVYAFPKNFRRHVGRSSAEGIDVIVIFSAETQVAYLGDIAVGFLFFIVAQQKDVLGLDIAVDEVLAVDMMQSLQNTPDNINALIELKNAIFPLGLSGVYIALVAVLHDYKYPSLVCKM
jgi:hypothetical protein